MKSDTQAAGNQDVLVSVVIPCRYNKEKSERLLFSCLDSVVNSSYKKLEVIVVDDGSEINLLQLLSKYPLNKRIELIQNEQNRGYGFACNRGAAIAKGKYICFLNDDMRAHNNMFEVLVREMESSPEVGILICKEVAYDNVNRIRSVGCSMDFFGNTLPRISNADSTYLFYAPGSPSFMRRGLFLSLNGFDETYYLYAEDLDLSWRVRLAGYDIKAAEQAIVHHMGSATIGSSSTFVSDETRLFLHKRNTLRTMEKNLSLRNLPLFITLFLFQSFSQIVFFLATHRQTFAIAIVNALVSNMRSIQSVISGRSVSQEHRLIGDDEIIRHVWPGLFLWYIFRIGFRELGVV